jgi:hypothetical protein
MGGVNSKPRIQPILFKSELFFGMGRFIDNNVAYPVYMPKGGHHFFMGMVPKNIYPTNSLLALTDEWREEHNYISTLLNDYPVETGSTHILNANCKFQEDRVFSMIPIVYFCPTKKIYKAGWWYVTKILLPNGEKIDEDD